MERGIPLTQEEYRDYVTVGEASSMLGVSIDTIRRWEKAGKIKAERLDGKNRYFAVDQLEEFKSTQTLSTSEVEKILGISSSTVRRLDSQGLLKASRDEKNRRVYNKSDVDRYKQTFETSDNFEIENNGISEPPVRHEDLELIPQVVTAEGESVLTGSNYSQSLFASMSRLNPLSGYRLQFDATPPGHKFPKLPKKIITKFFENIWVRAAFIGVEIFFATVIVLAVLFMVWPARMAALTGYWETSRPEDGHQNTDNYIIHKVTRPITDSALGIVSRVDPELKEYINPAKTDTEDTYEMFRVNSDGNISSSYHLTFPNSSYLKIPDQGLVANLNSEYVNGHKPGESSGDLGILPIDGSDIESKSVTTLQIADGTIQLNDL